MKTVYMAVQEHDSGLNTRIRCTTVDSAQVLRSKLLRELEAQVSISEPEVLDYVVMRPLDEGDRARNFVAMVM